MPLPSPCAGGNVFVSGNTNSGLNFPHSQTTPNVTSSSAFVVKFAQDGSKYVYSTLVGSTSFVIAGSLVVNGKGYATIGGATGAGFPIVSPMVILNLYGGGLDGFVLTLGGAGQKILYSAYLGSEKDDAVTGVAIGGSGNLFATGYTNSVYFPTTAGLKRTPSGKNDAFLMKIGK